MTLASDGLNFLDFGYQSIKEFARSVVVLDALDSVLGSPALNSLHTVT